MNSIDQPAPFPGLYQAPDSKLLELRQTVNFAHEDFLQLELRAEGRPRMLIVVGGYKPLLWPLTLLRIKEHAPADTDVCMVCPGKLDSDLRAACQAMGWSFLATRENKLSLAQNVAISLHPQAQWIHKLDEDIVIAHRYCENLEATYGRALEIDDCRVGFVAPTLNVNGFSYLPFLKFTSPAKLLEFRRLFGDSRSSCVDTAAWRDPKAAQFHWEQSMPFDHLAQLFSSRPTGYDICPHRFSIGAILFHRDLWTGCGGFTVASEGQLGVEEADLCAFCCDNAKLMLVSHTAFAGHVGFFPQAAHMIPWLMSRDINRTSGGAFPSWAQTAN